MGAVREGSRGHTSSRPGRRRGSEVLCDVAERDEGEGVSNERAISGLVSRLQRAPSSNVLRRF